MTSSKAANEGTNPGVKIKTANVRLSEDSPLLAARRSEDVDTIPTLSAAASLASSETAWMEDDAGREQTRSSWYLFLLTLSIGG